MLVKAKGIKILFITILLVYALVPTESSDAFTALGVQCLSASLLVVSIALGGFQNYDVRRRAPYFLSLFLAMVFAALLSFSLKFYVSILALILASVWSLAMDKDGRSKSIVLAALCAMMYLSAFVLVVQVIFFAAGRFVPFHSFVYPWSTARIQEVAGFARMGGLYIEPGTYANWMYAFFIFYTISLGHIPLKLGIVTAATIMLTFSAWGVIVGALMMLYLIVGTSEGRLISVRGSGKVSIHWKRLLSAAAVLSLSSVFALYFFSTSLIQYLTQRMSFDDGSGEAKVQMYNYFSDHWQSLIVLGQGFAPSFCGSCNHQQDAGVALSLSVVYGIPFAVVFFGLIFKGAHRQGGTSLLLLTVPLLATKIPYWGFILFMIFSSSLRPVSVRNNDIS